jgi:hypothetical protein
LFYPQSSGRCYKIFGGLQRKYYYPSLLVAALRYFFFAGLHSLFIKKDKSWIVYALLGGMAGTLVMLSTP